MRGEMSKWFMTQNRQILDLEKCVYFWIEHIEVYRIFAKTNDNIEWVIAEINEEKKADEYMNHIYDLLRQIK
jgi:hypothetical protein